MAATLIFLGWLAAALLVTAAFGIAILAVRWEKRDAARRIARFNEIQEQRLDRLPEDLSWHYRRDEARRDAIRLRGERIGWDALASEILAEATDDWAFGLHAVAKAVA